MESSLHAKARLADLLDDSPEERIAAALALARDYLDMEAGFVSEFIDGTQTFRVLDGDAASFGQAVDLAVPLETTYCIRLTRGEIPEVIEDCPGDPVTGSIPATHEIGIGAYVGIPIRFSDGSLYGTMCCLSHSARPDVKDRDVQFLHLLAKLVADQIERDRLFAANWRLRLTSTGARALIAALEERDGYTGEHSDSVVRLVGAVARRLDIDEMRVVEFEQVALLHDIGKIGIPDRILHKEGSLDADEWEVMKSHTIIGCRIVEGIEGLEHLAPAIRAEHERWDGDGYPDGLSGEDIPLASRIVLACDAFHAMISDRPYRKAIPVEMALLELARHAGTQFDPAVVDRLIAIIASEQPSDGSKRTYPAARNQTVSIARLKQVAESA